MVHICLRWKGRMTNNTGVKSQDTEEKRCQGTTQSGGLILRGAGISEHSSTSVHPTGFQIFPETTCHTSVFCPNTLTRVRCFFRVNLCCDFSTFAPLQRKTCSPASWTSAGRRCRRRASSLRWVGGRGCDGGRLSAPGPSGGRREMHREAN